MKVDKNTWNRLLLSWQWIYRSRETRAVGDQWRTEVMRRIRLIGPIGSQPVFLELFEQLVWRLSPATSLLILVLAALLLVSGLAQEEVLFSFFVIEPEELTLAQLLGFGG